MTQPLINRRTLLGGSLAAAALGLSGCAGSASPGTTSTAGTGASVSASNPFGVASGSAVDAVIFKGGWGSDYVDFAANVMKAKMGVTTTVSTTTQVAQELQPRFVGGNPPDLIDNAGAGAIGTATIVDQLEDLTTVINANNYEGTKIADTLYPGVTAAGTYGTKLAEIRYVMTVYGVWYSDSLFKANGWTAPKTWDEAYALGEMAKAAGKYLFLWGKEAATYYLTTMIGSAIKAGGDEVRLNLENLKPGCYTNQQPVKDVFAAMEKIIKAGMMKPGGSGTQFTAAQAQWSNAQEAILYPSGSWIENEMKTQTKEGFAMKGVPDLGLSASDKLPATALHAEAGEAFIVPSKGKNAAGGKELMRAMLSKEAATNFAKTRLASTIVKGLVPADGFGSTALQAQVSMLDAAAKNVFSFRSIAYYGMNKDNLVVMNSFLDGKLDAAGALSALQAIVDKVAADSNVKKIEIK